MQFFWCAFEAQRVRVVRVREVCVLCICFFSWYSLNIVVGGVHCSGLRKHELDNETEEYGDEDVWDEYEWIRLKNLIRI